MQCSCAHTYTIEHSIYLTVERKVALVSKSEAIGICIHELLTMVESEQYCAVDAVALREVLCSSGCFC